MPSEKGDVPELDELWSDVAAKLNTCWLWVALCRRTRQIVAYRRSTQKAALLPAGAGWRS